jgi:predicted transcriptional regulator
MRPIAEQRTKLYLDDPIDAAIHARLAELPKTKRSYEVKRILAEYFGISKDLAVERTVNRMSMTGMNELPVVEENISSTNHTRPLKSSKLVL